MRQRELLLSVEQVKSYRWVVGYVIMRRKRHKTRVTIRHRQAILTIQRKSALVGAAAAVVVCSCWQCLARIQASKILTVTYVEIVPVLT